MANASPKFAAIARRAAAMPQDNDEDDTPMMSMGGPMPQPEQAREAPYIAEKAPTPAKKKVSAAPAAQSPFGPPKKPQTFPGAKSGTNRGYV